MALEWYEWECPHCRRYGQVNPSEEYEDGEHWTQKCPVCGAEIVVLCSYDWQAIADELNAELGGGNCARCAEDMGRYADSLCDPLKERIAELLRCLENDWHISASWDGLRKFWNIELTEEGVRLRDAMHGALTADDVRSIIERHSDASGGNGRDFHNGAYKAIADELNARAERTCKCVSEYAKSPFDGKTIVLHRCSECHELMRPHMRYCPNCGAKVVDA